MWILMPALVIVLTAGPTATAEVAGEWTLLSSFSTGDYGTGHSTDIWATDFQYLLGDVWQLRVDIPYLAMDTAGGVVHTGAGTMPGGGHGQGESGGDGHGGGHGGDGDMGGGDGGGTITTDSSANGIGDIRLALSRRLVGGGVRVFRLDAEVEAKLPTADADQGLGTGEADFRLGFWSGYRFWSATLYTRAGWNWLGDPAWGELNDVLDLYVGLEGDPVASDRLIITGWASAAQEAVDGAGDLFNLGASVRTTGRVRWYGQLLVGLGEASPDMAVSIGFSVGRHTPGRIWKGGSPL